MSDLIKREDAIKATRQEPTYTDPLNVLTEVRDRIEAIPSADKQGEWIEQEDCWQCSECGDEYVLEVGVMPIDAKMNFCPNCGCRMKGADDEIFCRRNAELL